MEFLDQVSDCIRKAKQNEDDMNYSQALKYYHRAISILLHHKKFGTFTTVMTEQLRNKCSEDLNRAEKIKKLQKETVQETSTTPILNTDNFLVKNTGVSWKDVAGLEFAKSSLFEAIIIPMKFPNLFEDSRKPWKGILLFGPPGTGKSHLAKATATETNISNFISVTSAELVSKWLGESEKIIKQVFTAARSNQPSILFIDEIDALCSTRSDKDLEASRRIKTEFLIQMQNVSNVDSERVLVLGAQASRRIKTEFLIQMQNVSNVDSERVLVLGATSIPWELDPAVRRRFEKRIYVPLPDFQARKELFKLHIGKQKNSFISSTDLNELAEKTEGYSGSDISIVVRDALMCPLRTLFSNTHFKLKEDKWKPCSPGDPYAVEKSVFSIPEGQMFNPPLELQHLREAIQNNKPSGGNTDKMEQFMNEFGST